MKPFDVNDVVKVKRARHGWYDGKISASITERHVRETGTHFYYAKVVSASDDYDFKINETIKIEHTRDAYR